MDNSSYSIDPLTKAHDRQSFTSGNETLDTYLKKIARQDVNKDVATVFVVSRQSDPQTICGYYTLSTGSIPYVSLADDIQHIMPRYEMLPAVLLGRLAVAKNCQRRGLGETMLYDALLRALELPIAWAFFVVDAKEKAIGFYTQYGFEAFPETTTRLFMHKRDIARICVNIRS